MVSGSPSFHMHHGAFRGDQDRRLSPWPSQQSTEQPGPPDGVSGWEGTETLSLWVPSGGKGLRPGQEGGRGVSPPRALPGDGTGAGK